MQDTPDNPPRPSSGSMTQYLIVTLSYWGFTLSDGALRILVLFHFFSLGYSPFTLALLFLLYEAAGIVANLGGGWMATRFGITRMLVLGMVVQITGLLLLSFLDPSIGALASVLWVLAAQGIAGLAKDITKTASKSAIKVVSVEGDDRLFRWVAWFTGSKNAMKGFGFFLGGVMLTGIGFQHGLWLMAGLLAVIAVLISLSLPGHLGVGTASRSVRELFSKTPAVNMLALARVFLFGARDIWFVVGLPVFLYANGWGFWQVGGFLALWTIGYGIIQGLAPELVAASRRLIGHPALAAMVWAGGLMLVPVAIVLAMPMGPAVTVLVTGLMVFGFAFAVNSSLHSYLIVAFAGSKKAAEDIGFYYAANAAGRLVGTFLSGLLYQFGGIEACLIGSALFLLITTIGVARLPAPQE